MLPSYEVSHSALANGLTDIGMSNEARPRALIYAGCEGVFWRNGGKICFVIANRSGHYQTPKEYLEAIIPIMQALGYEDIVLIKNLEPDESKVESIFRIDSDDDSRYIWYISNCLDNYESVKEKLEDADTTPVINVNMLGRTYSMPPLPPQKPR
jgi:hypothetical protein